MSSGGGALDQQLSVTGMALWKNLAGWRGLIDVIDIGMVQNEEVHIILLGVCQERH